MLINSFCKYFWIGIPPIPSLSTTDSFRIGFSVQFPDLGCQFKTDLYKLPPSREQPYKVLFTRFPLHTHTHSVGSTRPHRRQYVLSEILITMSHEFVIAKCLGQDICRLIIRVDEYTPQSAVAVVRLHPEYDAWPSRNVS